MPNNRAKPSLLCTDPNSFWHQAQNALSALKEHCKDQDPISPQDPTLSQLTIPIFITDRLVFSRSSPTKKQKTADPPTKTGSITQAFSATNARLTACTLSSIKILVGLGEETASSVPVEREGYIMPPLLAPINLQKDNWKQEVVITFALYSALANTDSASEVYRLEQEVSLLASQPLTSLRDCIYCLKDYQDQSQADQSFTPWLSFIRKPGPSGLKFPSGYIFVPSGSAGGTFYNDMRSPNSIDYSAPILNWNQECTAAEGESAEHTLHLEACKMEETLIGQVQWDFEPLGKSFFVHMGDCRHLLVVRSCRLWHPALDSEEFPCLRFQRKFKRRKCLICDFYPACKVTVNDKLALENPCFWCEKCYEAFHVGPSEGQELLWKDFDLYPYFHDE